MYLYPMSFYEFLLAMNENGLAGIDSMEVDFIVQNENDEIIPIEVKAGENLKAKSFKYFCEKYKPENAIRTSLSDYRKELWMVNVPLYIIGNYL